MAIFSGIVAAIGSAFTAVSGFIGGLGAFGTFALKTVASFGVSLFAQRLGGNDDPVQASFGVSGQIQTAGDVARSFMLGLGATAGSMVYHNTWGVDNGTPNAFYTRVISLSDWPVAGFAEVWVNGEKATLDTANPHPQYGFPVLQYRTGGQDYCWVKFYDGTQTVADSFLTTRVSSAQRPYETTRVGTGVAYAICTSRTHPTLWTGWPTYLFALNGIKLYDVTKDSTQGGSGPQRWSDPSTWGGDGDQLPAVQAYNLLKGLRYGSDWFYGLQGLSQPRLPSAHWRAQIAKCRALIAGPNGMEPTYRSGAEIEVSAPLADAIEGLNTASSGRLAEIGGIYKMHVGAPDAPVFSFDDGFILSSEEQSFTPFFGLADTINGVTATYPSPAEGWKAKAAPPLYNADYEAEDGNRRLPTAVPLDFVSYDGQVQRLMKSALAEARRARRHTFSLPSDAWILEPGDTVEWSSSRNGYVEKFFRVDGVVDRANLDVLIDITEVDPTDYGWDQETDYTPPTGSVPGPIRPPAQTIAGFAAEAVAVFDNAGNPRRPGIKLLWPSTIDDVEAIAYEVRLQTSAAVIHRGRADQVGIGETIITSQAFLPATQYEVRAIYVPRGSRSVEWSDWLPVTTLNLGVGPLDVLDNAITAAKIADAAVTADKLMNEAVTSLKLAAEAVTSAKIQTGAVLEAKLAANAVTVGKIADGAVATGKLADAAITNAKLAPLAVDASKLADGAVVAAKFAAGLRPVEIVAALPSTGNIEGRTVYLTTDDKLYRWTGSAWTAAVPAGDITGQLTDAQLAAISAAKLTGQITSTQITDGAVSTPKLAAGSVIADKIAAAAVVAGKIAAAAVVTASIAAGAVTANELAANSVVAGKIAAAAVSTTELAANAITTDKIAANAIVGDKIAARSITAAKLIVSNSEDMIDNGNFLDGTAGWTFPAEMQLVERGSVSGATSQPSAPTYRMVYVSNTASEAQYLNNLKNIPVKAGEQFYASYWAASGGTGTSDGEFRLRVRFYFADGTNSYIDAGIATPSSQGWLRFGSEVTVPEGAQYTRVDLLFLPGATSTRVYFASAISVTRRASAELIVDGAIIAQKLAAGSVIAGKIAAGAVTATELAAGSVIAGKIAANAVVAASIAASAVTGDKIAANSVTADKLVANSISARELIVTDFTNLVQEPYFEKGGIGWTISNNLIANSDTYNSPFVLRMNASGSTVSNGNQFKTSPGDEFLLVVYADRSATIGASTINCRIRFGDINNSVLAGPSVTLSASNLTGNFQRFTATGVAPAGAVTGVAQILNSVTEGHIAVGFMGIFRRANAELIVDGAITADKVAANAITANKINVSSLSAISATLGSVDISQANIGTLTVGTSNIAPGAVTDVAVQGPYSGSGTSITLSLTYNHGPNAGLMVVTMSGQGRAADDGGQGSMLFRGTAAGSSRFSYTISVSAEDGGPRWPCSQTFTHQPAAGTTSTTFVFEIGRTSGSINVSSANMYIVVEQLKR